MLPPDSVAPLTGFILSSLSAGGLYLAQAAESTLPPIAKAWMDGGFSVALVSSLSYACVTLWRRLNQRDEHIATLNKEHRDELKAQRDELLTSLEKLTDRLTPGR
jgi:hypothetical protein